MSRPNAHAADGSTNIFDEATELSSSPEFVYEICPCLCYPGGDLSALIILADAPKVSFIAETLFVSGGSGHRSFCFRFAQSV